MRVSTSERPNVLTKTFQEEHWINTGEIILSNLKNSTGNIGKTMLRKKKYGTGNIGKTMLRKLEKIKKNIGKTMLSNLKNDPSCTMSIILRKLKNSKSNTEKITLRNAENGTSNITLNMLRNSTKKTPVNVVGDIPTQIKHATPRQNNISDISDTRRSLISQGVKTVKKETPDCGCPQSLFLFLFFAAFQPVRPSS